MESSGALLRIVRATPTIAAFALLARIGGYGQAWLPPPLACLSALVLLLGAERMLRPSAAGAPGASFRSARDWVSAHWFWLGLGTLLLLALANRMLGIGSDLGRLPLDVDENRLNQNVLVFFSTGELHHDTVEHYPGIHFWLLTGAYLLTFLWGLLAGVTESLATTPRELFALAGRLVSALEGTITVLLAALLARRLAGPAAGLLAAGLLALSPLAVDVSSQLRNDAGQVMLVTAAVFVALRAQASGAAGESLLAGVLAGLAAAVKYSGVFAFVPAALAALTTRARAARGRSLALASLGFVAALLVSNHFIWADFPNFVRQLADQVEITRADHWAAQPNAAAFHASLLRALVVGWPMMLLAAIFVARKLATEWRWWLALSFPLLYVPFVAQRPSQFPRWVYPSAPFVAVAAAAALVALLRWGAQRRPVAHRPARFRFAAGLLASLAVLFPILWESTVHVSRKLTPPTYILIEDWLEQRAAPGDRILLQFFTLDLDPQRFELTRLVELDDALEGGAYQLAAYDWIVVGEEFLQHPALSRLRLVESFIIDNSFAGNRGPDFAVYAPPAVDPLAEDADVRLDQRAAAPYLGLEWSNDRSGEPGLLLPAAGASLYLPPLAKATTRLDLLIWRGPTAPDDPGNRDAGLIPGGADETVAPIEAAVRGRPLGLERLADEDTASVFTTELSRLVVGPGVGRVVIRPVDPTATLRVLGFRLR